MKLILLMIMQEVKEVQIMCGGGPRYPEPLTAEEMLADTNNPYKNPSGYSAPRWKPEEFKKEQDIALAKERAAALARRKALSARAEEEGRDRSSGRGPQHGKKTRQQKANLAKNKRRAKQAATARKHSKQTQGASDIRLKENIKEIGLSPLGYKIYEFNYKGKDVRYRGAMAQDVITKLPQAINVKDGYFYVDYDMIDITMEVIE